MRAPPPRIVTLVLVDRAGVVAGHLPPFPVATPWWQDAGPVVSAARERFGLKVTVLRILETESPVPHGGAVTYLAEMETAGVAGTAGASALMPWAGALADDPRRHPYARPGGPSADLDWADGALVATGVTRTGPAEQDRTWNLSSLWRLPTSRGHAWLKVVPSFFGHEGGLLEQLAGEAVPALIASDGQRLLLADIAGEDQYDATLPTLLQMVDLLVDLQARWSRRIGELRAIGLPDWRGPAVAEAIATVVERSLADVTPVERAALAGFVAGLPDRLAAIDACGLPDTLVHGDFHPGNVRGVPGRLVLLDWGDSGVGHPLLDEPAFVTRIDPGAVPAVRTHWHAAWRAVVPGSEPDRAAVLLAPIAAARQAVIYRGFLDRIEASEQRYHRADVPDWLARTVAILRGDDQPGR